MFVQTFLPLKIPTSIPAAAKASEQTFGLRRQLSQRDYGASLLSHDQLGRRHCRRSPAAFQAESGEFDSYRRPQSVFPIRKVGQSLTVTFRIVYTYTNVTAFVLYVDPIQPYGPTLNSVKRNALLLAQHCGARKYSFHVTHVWTLIYLVYDRLPIGRTQKEFAKLSSKRKKKRVTNRSALLSESKSLYDLLIWNGMDSRGCRKRLFHLEKLLIWAHFCAYFEWYMWNAFVLLKNVPSRFLSFLSFDSTPNWWNFQPGMEHHISVADSENDSLSPHSLFGISWITLFQILMLGVLSRLSFGRRLLWSL